MATALSFPLYHGFFPQVVLTMEQLMHYRRLGADRVVEMARIIEDAECLYRWTDVKARNGRTVHRAHFVDKVRAETTQSTSDEPSTLYTCSLHLVDVQPEDILDALAKVPTNDARRTMQYMHGHDFFVDTQTLLTFPTSLSEPKGHPRATSRTIKWSLFKPKRREAKGLDFCYFAYAGKKKQDKTTHERAHGLVGFWIQESVAPAHQVPTLERFGIVRGQLRRTGIVITKTHQSNIVKVTSMAQVDGTIGASDVRMAMDGMMVDYVAAVHRIKGLLERQRMGRLQYLNEWDWVSTKDRKACAVCVRAFYFRRKHHCATCGEVVCSSCAPLREVDEPLHELMHRMRVCSLCMAQAGSHRDSSLASEHEQVETTTVTTTNMGTEAYLQWLRDPKHPGRPRERRDEDTRPASTSQRPPHALSSHHSAPESERTSSQARVASDSLRQEPPSSRCRPSSSSRPPKEEALEKLVAQVREIRDKINVALLEAENERQSSMGRESDGKDSHVSAEHLDERMLKIRDILDVSSSEFDAVLKGRTDHGMSRSVDAMSDRFQRDGGASGREGTPSEERSEGADCPSPCSSLLSTSAPSLARQDAGESLPPATRDAENSDDDDDDDDARALEEAMAWACQADPSATLRSCRPRSPMAVSATASAPARAAPSQKRGIERLALKIERLHERLEAAQRETTQHSTMAIASTTPALVRDEPTDNTAKEAESERDPRIDRRSPSSSATDSPRSPGPPANKQETPRTAREAPASSVDAVKPPQPARVAGPARAPPDLVASLRGVMNSSELTHVPPRRPIEATSPVSSPSLPHASVPSSRRAPPPPPRGPPLFVPGVTSRDAPTSETTSAVPLPLQGTTVYVYDPDDHVQKVQRRSVGVPTPRETGGTNDVCDRDNGLSSLDEEHEAHDRHPDRAWTRRVGARDESRELRELMEGLAQAPLRSRCWSGQSTGAPPSEKLDV
ncbi:hypothetical protein PsorP6_017628 [Peronosclerospora sorghi]|uniref:Uncharacterized protein n=1 Tax=Peronosclerospora sorghi TaxID=230839 RepID=A0ACC0WN79_9STRA|nr:hypothetical protein PsorP6_017628 [Peronosclerospora sorghi]